MDGIYILESNTRATSLPKRLEVFLESFALLWIQPAAGLEGCWVGEDGGVEVG